MEGLIYHASWVLAIFLICYAAIILEQYIKINKACTALFMAVGCWTILFQGPEATVSVHLDILSTEMFKVTQVLFFLMGALTIVEIINQHRGFHVVTDMLHISSKRRLMWAIGIITFFLSSVLDNLTSTIVMVSLVHKLLANREDRLLIGGIIVIAANAGGAWTPIGDVATTLLWISEKITTIAVMRDVFLPSLVCLLVPLLLASKNMHGEVEHKAIQYHETSPEPYGESIFFIGIAALIFVPFFKMMTGLPPFLGMMLGLAVLWLFTDLVHDNYKERDHLRVQAILPKVDMTIIIFYLGILLGIMSLEAAGLLAAMSQWLNIHLPYPNFMAIIIGLISSTVDNVSLVAATIGIYSHGEFPPDSAFWQLITFCAGTGGSILIIGSAAGVAFMALEKVDFMWYMRKIAPLALAGYFAGITVYLLIYTVII